MTNGSSAILGLIPLAQSLTIASKALEPKDDLKDIVSDFSEIIVGTKLNGFTKNELKALKTAKLSMEDKLEIEKIGKIKLSKVTK